MVSENWSDSGAKNKQLYKHTKVIRQYANLFRVYILILIFLFEMNNFHLRNN